MRIYYYKCVWSYSKERDFYLKSIEKRPYLGYSAPESMREKSESNCHDFCLDANEWLKSVKSKYPWQDRDGRYCYE